MSDLRNKIVHAMLKEGAACKSLSDRWDRMADAAIALIRAEVLEEAAIRCEAIANRAIGAAGDGAMDCADAIRALKENPDA